MLTFYLIHKVSYYPRPKAWDKDTSDKDNIICATKEVTKYYQITFTHKFKTQLLSKPIPILLDSCHKYNYIYLQKYQN